MDPGLVALAAETSKKASESGDPRLSKKSKGDFTSVYAAAKMKEIEMLKDTKNKELEIKSNRLDLDTKIAEADLELRKNKQKSEDERGAMDLAFAKESKSPEIELARETTDKTLKEATRRELAIALVKEGKTPTVGISTVTGALGLVPSTN